MSETKIKVYKMKFDIKEWGGGPVFSDAALEFHRSLKLNIVNILYLFEKERYVEFRFYVIFMVT